MEESDHDWRLSSISKIAGALHLPSDGVDLLVRRFLEEDEDSVTIASIRILVQGFASWPLHLFNFVDAFRRKPAESLIKSAPIPEVDRKIQCLLTSTVEALCLEAKIETPEWCRGVSRIERPWFVADVESMKAISLVESPLSFRKRNIFVLGNFMERV